MRPTDAVRGEIARHVRREELRGESSVSSGSTAARISRAPVPPWSRARALQTLTIDAAELAHVQRETRDEIVGCVFPRLREPAIELEGIPTERLDPRQVDERFDVSRVELDDPA